MHYYGYREEDIEALSLAQFNARVQDVGEIENMLKGEGPGRVVRTPYPKIKPGDPVRRARVINRKAGASYEAC